jgi:hypothetical protein
MAERREMGETELKALVSREISLAVTDGQELAKRRTKALKYYQGDVADDLPAETGRSRVVSRDLADGMGWTLPQLMRVFCASDRMAVFEPVGDEDEKFAKQATDGINYVFWKENPGYRVLRSATWDALLGGNGVVKVYWDDTPRDVISYHSGLDDEAYAELVADDSVEVLAHSEDVQQIDTPEGPVAVALHTLKIRKEIKGGKTCIEAIPPEDYGIDGEAKTCKEARFQYHRTDKTRSDLIEMGFDKTKVMSLGKKGTNNSSEETARTGRESTDDGDQSMEIVDLYECYVRVDVDGDGIAEMCRIYYAGNSGGGEVLDWEVWEDEAPFHDIPFNPMPHRWAAGSFFDETEDVQQIKTAMLRQANDNTYATNNPQRHVKGEILNPEELFSPNFGGAIFGKADSEIVPLVVPFVANHAYDALNYQDQVLQRRTGVGRQTMALDPEALTNQSATANQNEKDANYSQVELVARDMAELGWVDVFRAILRIEVKHQKLERTIRLGGKPIRIDPKWWNAEMDVTINVGLGTGSRDRDMRMLQFVLTTQITMADRFIASGAIDDAIDMLPKILNTMTKIAESAGLRNPESFYPEYTEEKIAKLKEMAAVKAQQPPMEVQLKQMDVEATAKIEELKAQGNVVKEKAQLEADERTRALELNNALILQQEQIASAERLKEAELAFKKYDTDTKARLEMMKLSQVETEEDGPPDAEGKPTKTKVKVVDNSAMLMDAIQSLGAMLSAPTEIVRDPQGRAVGTRRVVN